MSLGSWKKVIVTESNNITSFTLTNVAGVSVQAVAHRNVQHGVENWWMRKLKSLSCLVSLTLTQKGLGLLKEWGWWYLILLKKKIDPLHVSWWFCLIWWGFTGWIIKSELWSVFYLNIGSLMYEEHCQIKIPLSPYVDAWHKKFHVFW